MKNKNNDFFESHGILFNDDLSSMSHVSIKVIGDDGTVLKEASSKKEKNTFKIIGSVLGGVSEALSDKNRIARDFRLMEIANDNLIKKHKVIFYITIFILIVNFFLQLYFWNFY